MVGAFQPGPMRDDDVRKIEKLAPPVPVGQAEKSVHPQQAGTASDPDTLCAVP